MNHRALRIALILGMIVSSLAPVYTAGPKQTKSGRRSRHGKSNSPLATMHGVPSKVKSVNRLICIAE